MEVSGHASRFLRRDRHPNPPKQSPPVLTEIKIAVLITIAVNAVARFEPGTAHFRVALACWTASSVFLRSFGHKKAYRSPVEQLQCSTNMDKQQDKRPHKLFFGETLSLRSFCLNLTS